jgi:hypothetical protein
MFSASHRFLLSRAYLAQSPFHPPMLLSRAESLEDFAKDMKAASAKDEG